VIDIGQLITAYMFMQILPALLLNSIIGYQTIKQAQGATSNVAEILETENEILKRKRSFSLPDDDIKFKNVSFSYDKEKVLSNLNLIIPKGKVTAIVGPSGSGKTTILNLLERFYIPNSGHIKFGSVPIEDIHVDEWRDAIGYVPQRSPLLVGSIWDNIVYGIHREIKEDSY
jgi:ATP-binding cassette subfamily B protein AbcA/BmrA